ncbi:MAG: hypothetical protein GY932_12680 [Arcobacter sp.]|nr:hypothetical protein [Arcobacter sp.]
MQNNYLKKAIEADKNNKLDESLINYIKAIEYNENMSSYNWLHAGIIFGLCQDYGTKTEYKISNESQDKAWQYFEKCLDNVSHNIEGKFWKLYIYHILQGEKSFEEEAREFLEFDITPIFYIISFDNSKEVFQKAKELYKICINKSTERERYICSVLEQYLII